MDEARAPSEERAAFEPERDEPEEPEDEDAEREPEDRMGRHAAGAVGEKLRETAERETEEAAELDVPEHPPFDPQTRTCGTCSGWGIVRTGSIVEGHTVRRCNGCGGVGFQERRKEPGTEGETAAPPVESVPDETPGAWVWPDAAAV